MYKRMYVCVPKWLVPTAVGTFTFVGYVDLQLFLEVQSVYSYISVEYISIYI